MPASYTRLSCLLFVFLSLSLSLSVYLSVLQYHFYLAACQPRTVVIMYDIKKLHECNRWDPTMVCHLVAVVGLMHR